MPKLDKSVAETASTAEVTGDFEPLLPGKYLAQLAKVDVRDKTNKYGAEQWSAEFQNLHTLRDQERVSGRQWLNLTLPTSAKAPAGYDNGQEKWDKYQGMLAGRLREFFESAGYSTDSDTDEMIGEWFVLNVTRETVNAGPKQGQMTNRVNSVSAVPDSVTELPESQEFGDSWSTDDEF